MPLRLAALGALVAAGITLYATGVHAILAPEQLRESILSLGVWGPVLFVVGFAVLEPLHVPGIFFLLAAPLTWPLPQAFLLSLAGATGAGICGFVFARFIGRDWAQRHLPQRLRAWDDRLATHGFRSGVLLRLLLFLAPPTHWLIGLSSVRFAPAVAGTVIGLAPGILLVTWIGESLVTWLAALPAAVWGVALAAVVTLLGWRSLSARVRPVG